MTMPKETISYREKRRNSTKETYLAGKSPYQNRPALETSLMGDDTTDQCSSTSANDSSDSSQCLVCALNAFQYLVSTENLLCHCETVEKEASEVF